MWVTNFHLIVKGNYRKKQKLVCWYYLSALETSKFLEAHTLVLRVDFWPRLRWILLDEREKKKKIHHIFIKVESDNPIRFFRCNISRRRARHHLVDCDCEHMNNKQNTHLAQLSVLCLLLAVKYSILVCLFVLFPNSNSKQHVIYSLSNSIFFFS